jgi:hypothetical protein
MRSFFRFLLFFFISVPIFSVWHAFVLKVLWGWFIVPKFQLPGLSLIEAWGIILLVELVCKTPTIINEKLREEAASREKPEGSKDRIKEAEQEAAKINWGQMTKDYVAKEIGFAGITLMTGWIIHFFV